MTTCLGKSLSFGFTVRVFHRRVSICVCSSFPFGFEGRMWDLVVLIPDCLSIYLLQVVQEGFQQAATLNQRLISVDLKP